MHYHSLFNNHLYQVFIFSSPLPFPLSFAVHTWVVTNKKGETNRWEVWQSKNAGPISWGHVNKNMFRLTSGVRIWYKLSNKRFNSKLIHFIEGDEKSGIPELIEFIEIKAPDYKYRDTYHYVPGPNSNTFTQWIVNHLNTGNVLPWNAFGKRYERLFK